MSGERDLWRENLRDLKPLFGDAAQKCSDAALVVWGGYALDLRQLHNLTDKTVRIHINGLPIVRGWQVGDLEKPCRTHRNEDDKITEEGFVLEYSFHGDASGAGHFQRLAEAGAACLGPPQKDVLPINRSTGCAPLLVPGWCSAIFHVASKSLAGIGLRATRTVSDNWPEGSYYSILHGNPFQASMILIDYLLASCPEADANTRLWRKRARTGDPKPPNLQKPRKPRGGKLSEAETRQRRELMEKWKRAKEAKVSRKQFCKDEGISIEKLDKAVDFCQRRMQRTGKIL